MNERDIQSVLDRAARAMTVPPRFKNPSALVKEVAARHRRQRWRVLYGVGVMAAAAVLAVSLWLQIGHPSPLKTVQDQPAPKVSAGRPRFFTLDQRTVKEMAAASSLIVRGTVEKRLETWNLAHDPNFRTENPVFPGTDYEVRVEQYAKGFGGSTVVVTIPGGTYEGENEVEEVEIGKEYLFFLVPLRGPNTLTPDGQQRYKLVPPMEFYEIRNGIAYPGGIPTGYPDTPQPMPVDELVNELVKKAQ